MNLLNRLLDWLEGNGYKKSYIFPYSFQGKRYWNERDYTESLYRDIKEKAGIKLPVVEPEPSVGEVQAIVEPIVEPPVADPVVEEVQEEAIPRSAWSPERKARALAAKKRHKKRLLEEKAKTQAYLLWEEEQRSRSLAESRASRNKRCKESYLLWKMSNRKGCSLAEYLLGWTHAAELKRARSITSKSYDEGYRRYRPPTENQLHPRPVIECRECGAHLTDPESRRRGIGPCCALSKI